MSRRVKAFTIIELLVVISVISLLLAILLPVLNVVRSHGKTIVCQSNTRQLALANAGYAGDSGGYYVPAALDIFGANNHRWYGVRDNNTAPFDTTRSPLAPYLDNVVLKCPAKVRFKELSPLDPEYDAGGGYGYNMAYIGSKIWQHGYEDAGCKDTARDVNIAQPSLTLMFADTAMAKGDSCIEYSFAEPRYFIADEKPVLDAWDPSPSIHFRHRQKANIAWADGHVDSKKMGISNVTNPDDTKPEGMNIGWFEPMDNTLFDLK